MAAAVLSRVAPTAGSSAFLTVITVTVITVIMSSKATVEPGPKDSHAQHTIDQLAAVSGVPSRTIRYYQSAGALQKPKLQGRVAYYGPVHIERLELIAKLQDRGLTIKAICALVRRIDKGEVDLSEWLGLDAQLEEPWANESPKLLSKEELYTLVGKRHAGLLAQLQRAKLVERKGEVFLVQSPGHLNAALRLEAAGVDLETAVEGLTIIKKHARRAAKDLAKYFFKRAAAGFDRGASASDLTEAFSALRPVSQQALRLSFGQEMERVLHGLVKSGKATKIPRRKKQPKNS